MSDSMVIKDLKEAYYMHSGLAFSADETYDLWAEFDARDRRIAELEAARIEWVFEDQLPDGIPDAVYSAMYACSEVDFVRVFPSVTVEGRKRFLIELPEVQE